MNIKHLHIYGFGKWVDYSLALTPTTFNGVYGGNEAGKSTLHHFILFMLFGLPPKQRDFYRSKTSGKLGGRLTVSDATVGDYIIERMDEVQNGAARCFTEDGSEHDEAWLNNRLNGMNAQIYQSIYAFSALDLVDLKHMQGDDLGEIILGIGLTGSAQLHTLENSLETQMTTLFRPGGKVPLINQQLTTLEQLNRELVEYKKHEQTYQTKQQSVMDLKQGVKAQQKQLTEQREALFTIDRQRHNLQTIHDYHTYKQALAQSDDVIPFPENGLARLASLKEQILPLKSQLAVLEETLAKNEAEKSKLTGQLANEARYKTTGKLIDSYQNAKLQEQMHQKKQQDIVLLASQLDESVRTLNIGLTVEEIESLSFPFYLEKTWSDLQQQEKAYYVEQEQIDQAKQTLAKQEIYLQDHCQQLEANLLTDAQLDHYYQQIDSYKEESYHQKMTLQNTKQQRRWKQRKKAKTKQAKLTVLGSILLGVTLGITGFMMDSIPFLLAMALVLLIGGFQWFLVKQSLREMTDLLAQQVTLDQPSSRVTEEEKAKAEQALEMYQRDKNELHALKKQLKTIQIDTIKWAEKETGLTYQQERLKEQITDQIILYPFLNEVALPHWLELYQTINHLIEQARQKNELINEVAAIEKEQEVFAKEVQAFLSSEGEDALLNHPFDQQVEQIEQIRTDFKLLTKQVQQKEAAIEQMKEEQAHLAAKKKAYLLERHDLFALAHVDQEDDFHQQANKKQTKQHLNENYQKTLTQLNVIFTPAELVTVLDTRLDQSILQHAQEEMITAIKATEEDLEQMRQQIATLQADLNHMESSESYSQTMHTFIMEQDTLKEQAKSWAVLKVAKEMLAETKRAYRDQHLTKVIERTSYFFQFITGGNYQRVLAPQGERLFQVETPEQLRYDVSELSQGTIDQLYICLRLAVSEMMSTTYQLPFIIDDGLIHFDDERTVKMVELLIQLSEKQQIIYFTNRKTIKKQLAHHQLIRLPASGR